MPGFKGVTRSRLLLCERRSQCSMEGNDWFGSNLGTYPRVEQAGGIFSIDDIYGFTPYMASWDRKGSLSYMQIFHSFPQNKNDSIFSGFSRLHIVQQIILP